MNKLFKTTLYTSLALNIVSEAYADNIEMNTAHLQAMDKITGRVSELNVPVNGLANFGTFSILVRKCVSKSPEETPENTAFIDIVDNYKSPNPINIFKGWMFSSTPGINGVEHPIYDIWLLKCYNSDSSKHHVLTNEQLEFRDKLPIFRQEKQEQNIKLSTLDEETPVNEIKEIKIQSNETIEQNQSTKQNEENIIKIDIDNDINENTSSLDNSNNDTTNEDFVAEGEEIDSETILINNETVAQDAEYQKTLEEDINNKESSHKENQE